MNGPELVAHWEAAPGRLWSLVGGGTEAEGGLVSGDCFLILSFGVPHHASLTLTAPQSVFVGPVLLHKSAFLCWQFLHFEVEKWRSGVLGRLTHQEPIASFPRKKMTKFPISNPRWELQCSPSLGSRPVASGMVNTSCGQALARQLKESLTGYFSATTPRAGHKELTKLVTDEVIEGLLMVE